MYHRTEPGAAWPVPPGLPAVASRGSWTPLEQIEPQVVVVTVSTEAGPLFSASYLLVRIGDQERAVAHATESALSGREPTHAALTVRIDDGWRH